MGVADASWEERASKAEEARMKDLIMEGGERSRFLRERGRERRRKDGMKEREGGIGG